MQEYARVCQSMPEYAKVCKSMPEDAIVCHRMCLSHFSHPKHNIFTKKYLRVVLVKALRNSVFAWCGESLRQSGGAQVFLIGVTIISIIAIYAVLCVNIIYTNTLTQLI